MAKSSRVLVAIAINSFIIPCALAYSLHEDDRWTLNADAELSMGVFHSNKSYAQSSASDAGSSSWQEAAFKYGLSGTLAEVISGQLYGSLNWVSTGSFGDGDAAGWTDGTERTTKIEDAYAGWRSGSTFPSLGDNGLDISFGRQNIVIGDGFLVAGDALNLGKGGTLNRGGAYYLAGRKDFDQTAVLRVGGASGLRSDLMWLQSDNPAQAKAGLAVATLENVTTKGTIGLTYLEVTNTDKRFDYLNRDGTKTYSLRGQGNIGYPDLFLSAEYALQRKDDGTNENAWYVEAGWKFSDLYLRPTINYRYSRFSEGYDPLFYGNVRALGTWFQGEVASNYAGPFNSNTRINSISLSIAPTDAMSIGMLLFNFDTLGKAENFTNLNAKEIDAYALWNISEHTSLMPLVGIYKPDAGFDQGGSQLGHSGSNVYTQLLITTKF